MISKLQPTNIKLNLNTDNPFLQKSYQVLCGFTDGVKRFAVCRSPKLPEWPAFDFTVELNDNTIRFIDIEKDPYMDENDLFVFGEIEPKKSYLISRREYIKADEIDLGLWLHNKTFGIQKHEYRRTQRVV